eukprot:s3492_g11.t1
MLKSEKGIKTIPPTPLMASHYGSELSRTIANVFVDTVRELPAYFNIQQPLQLRHMHAETADNVRKLTNHMQLNQSDAHWLQCLASELHPEAGHALIPDLWELKRRVATAVERQHEEPREPSPFRLPPAALDAQPEHADLPLPLPKRRPRSSSPGWTRATTEARKHPCTIAHMTEYM